MEKIIIIRVDGVQDEVIVEDSSLSLKFRDNGQLAVDAAHTKVVYADGMWGVIVISKVPEDS